MPDFDTWSWDRSCFSTRINQAIRAGPFSKLRSKFSLFSSLIHKLDHFLELQNQQKLNYSSAKMCHNSQTPSKSWQPCLWFFSSCWYCFCAASDPGSISLFRSAGCSLRKDFPWCGTWVEREIQPWWCSCRGECWGSDGGHNRLVQQEPEMNPEAAALIAICRSYSSLQYSWFSSAVQDLHLQLIWCLALFSGCIIVYILQHRLIQLNAWICNRTSKLVYYKYTYM